MAEATGSPALDPLSGAHLDHATQLLVRAAAAIAGGGEQLVRATLGAMRSHAVPEIWVEELILQSHLFSGLPRALNAMREWRRIVPAIAPDAPGDDGAWRSRGEATCAAVYGDMYHKLRRNIAALHPAFDDWMIVDGYGKVLSRPGLDLGRRELCIVAACAISLQDRQLHSHLHGAVNVGVSPPVLTATITAIADLLGAERAESVRSLLGKVLGR